MACSDKETDTTENVRDRHESVSTENTPSQAGIEIPKQAASINTCNVTIRKSRKSIEINPSVDHVNLRKQQQMPHTVIKHARLDIDWLFK